MKKTRILATVFSMVLCLQFLSTVWADSTNWICAGCGTENQGRFCGKCGASAASAVGEERGISLTRSEEWFCKNCGSIVKTDFCTCCGTKRKENLVGSILIFGTYEQDNNLSNGSEPIEWIVLAESGNKVFVISKLLLDYRPYNTTMSYVTWATSSIREWLNNDFIASAFNAEEKTRIVITQVDNSDSQGDPSIKKNYGSAQTQDRVFLLSCKEVLSYLPNIDAATAEKSGMMKAEHPITSGYWILRSINSKDGVSNALGLGKLLSANYVDSPAFIRPAMWINLQESNS